MRPIDTYAAAAASAKIPSRSQAQRSNWLKLARTQAPSESAEGRLVEETVQRLRDEARPAISEEAKTDFRAILNLIDAEPVEDGRTHPAERLLSSFAERHGRVCLLAVALNWWPPVGDGRKAALLRLLGRDPDLTTTPARVALVREGLESASADIRDAAAQASELWSDRALIEVLTRHNEDLPWLRHYIQDIISSLSD